MVFELLLGLLLLLAVPLCVIGVAASTARKWVNQALRLEPADPNAIPADIAEALLPSRSTLAALDFELLNHVEVYASALEHQPAWGLTWCDQTTTHYACLSAMQPFHQVGLILCDFVTVLDDDRHVITTNAKNYHRLRPYPGDIRQHVVGASIVELWEAHQRRLAAITAIPVPLSLSEFNDRLHQQSLNRLRDAAEQGAMQWVIPDQTYRYTWMTAIGFTTRVAIGMFGQSKQIRVQSATAQQIQVQQEVKTFLENRAPKPILSKQKRGWLALGSLALFAAIYATHFGSLALVLFLGALLLHEGGHLLAMLIFGYRNPAVLFIPFLGALATARKDHASLTEKVWISLAGPLPGLILGIAIALIGTRGASIETVMTNWYREGNLWREASQILIGLNLFNLMPIYPLDGGQISDLLVFSRNAYLGVIYRSIGVALLLLLGLFNPVMLVFALLIAFTIPSSFRIAHWFAQLKGELRDIPWQDNETAAQLVFTRLQAAPTLSSFQKNTIVSGIIESRRADTAPWWSRLGLSAIYLVSLLGGITGGLYAIMPDVKAVSSSVASAGAIFQGPGGSFRNRLKEADTAIANNPKDWDAYMKRAYAKLYLKDFQGTIDDASAYLSQDPKSFETHHWIKAYRLRASAYRELGDRAKAQADEHKAQEIQWMPQFQKAQAALKKNPKDLQAYIDRAEAKDGFDDRDGAFQDVAIALKINPKSADVLLMRSSLFERQQDYPAALKDLDRVIELEPNNADAYGLRSELYDQLGEDAKAKADEAKSLELFAQSPEGKANPKMVEALKRLQSLPRND